MTENFNCWTRPGESAVKCLFQENNRSERLGFEPHPFDHNHHTLNTRPRCLRLV